MRLDGIDSLAMSMIFLRKKALRIDSINLKKGVELVIGK